MPIVSADEYERIKKDFAEAGEQPLQRAYCQSYRIVRGELHIRFLLAANRPPEEIGCVFFKFRQEQVRYHGLVSVRQTGLRGLFRNLSAGDAGIRIYQIDCMFNVPWSELPSSLYGVDVVSSLGSNAIRTSKGDLLFPTERDTLYCFRDPSGRMLRIELYHLDRKTVEGLRTYMPETAHHPRCLIGEYSNSARDNGLALYNGMCGRADISARYVVETDNADGLKPDGSSILAFGSLEHLRAAVSADVVAFTHHAHYVLPGIIRHLRRTNFLATKRFFLQHGITALKASMSAYRRSRTNYDLINVCSELEQSIVARACQFDPDDVVIAGFPRHDELLHLAQGATPDTSRVLVFPTWRKGLERLDSSAARSTPFVERWIAALDAIRARDVHVTFILHPAIRHHAGLFEGHVDELADVGEFQAALVSASALLTDYSSVCFEALYIGKPVFFFTFDAAEFQFAENAYIDVSTQLPGLRLDTPESVADAIEASQAAGWPMSRQAADRFFAHRDDRNAERCAEAILALAQRRASSVEDVSRD
jgi:CDP-glycerol glycerophosphotransferase (TagB/SpsB family)